MKTLKINRKNLSEFIFFAIDNDLEFKKCVKDLSFKSILIGEDVKAHIFWEATAETETLKAVIEIINTLLINCKLEFEEIRK